MITLPDTPEPTLKKLANEVFYALINRDYGVILGKISNEYGRWTRERLETELLKASHGRWPCEFHSIPRSACSVMTGDAKMYEYRHRLPLDDRWADSCVILRLHQKAGPRYALELVGFGALYPGMPEPQPAAAPPPRRDQPAARTAYSRNRSR